MKIVWPVLGILCSTVAACSDGGSTASAGGTAIAGLPGFVAAAGTPGSAGTGGAGPAPGLGVPLCSAGVIPPPLPRQLCNGSEGIQLGYRVEAGGQELAERRMLRENGYEYFYIDGQCNYWVFGASSIPQINFVSVVHGDLWPMRTGRLDPQQRAQLAHDLLYDRWPELYGEYSPAPGCSHCGWEVFLHVAGAITCGQCSERPELKVVRDAARAWLPLLYQLGHDAAGPMRIVAADGIRNDFGGRVLQWTLDFPLAEITLKPFTDSRGRGRLVKGKNAAKVRAMRQQYMHVLPTATDGSVPVAEPGGKVWALYLRDAMPFEDTAGTLCFGP